MILYGEFLKEPWLKFDYSSEQAKAPYSRSKKTLQKFGPYDSNIIPKEEIQCAILFAKNNEKEKQILVDSLINGSGNFTGFENFFHIPLKFISEFPLLQKNEKELEFIISRISLNNPDLVYVILDNNLSEFYVFIKLQLLLNGIVSQMVKVERFQDMRGLQYILENIALSTYAKIGGTPWTISMNNHENALILGVSRVQDTSQKYFVGFVTLFTNDGDFIFMHSQAPVIEWDNYVKGLSELIENAIYEYEKIKGSPESIIVHFHKRPGKKELYAIEEGIKQANKNIPFAIIHINEYSNFRLFDTTDISYIPSKGFKVTLSTREVLLLIDGRINGQRYRIGVPRVLNIRMDRRSTLDLKKFPEIVKQIYNFSFINWRSFNAGTLPVTLSYSKLIAQKVKEFGIKNWSPTVASGRLRDKAWFL